MKKKYKQKEKEIILKNKMMKKQIKTTTEAKEKFNFIHSGPSH
jgi:hypothetical protein